MSARGLNCYVGAVAAALGLPPDAYCSEVDKLCTAYVALEHRFPGHVDLDVALLWDEERGWTVAIETLTVDDPVMLAYLGADILPDPGAVVAFVQQLVAGEIPAQRSAPALRCRGDNDGLAQRLILSNRERSRRQHGTRPRIPEIMKRIPGILAGAGSANAR